MLNKKEIIRILIVFAILTISISLIQSVKIFLLTGLAILLIIAINIFAKKILAYYLDSEIEIKIWKIQRYGFKPKRKLKKAFPAGIFLPIIISVLSLGNLIWMACFVFDVKPKVYRSAKKHGLYSFSELTEYQIGLIAVAGVLANLCFAVIGYFSGWGLFAKLNVWYAFFNIIPLSDLDGNKIFFGNLVLWSFLASIVIIALGYVFLLI